MCTGLEPLLATMGTAAGASTLGTQLAMMVGGQLLGKALGGSQKAPSVPTPEKPPQATKTPDRPAILAAAGAAARPGGASAGNSSTFLTGPSGIDPTTLNLGKNTLLGQ